MRTLKLVLKVDCIGGTTIMQACIELCEMAKRIGCMVEADFNGYRIRALPGDDPAKHVEQYRHFKFL